MAQLTGGRRILVEWLIIALLSTAGLVAAVSAGLFKRADNLVYDRLIWLQRQPASDDIIIVAIDDESIARLGRFPWRREVHAIALRNLQAANPKAIMYDVLFVEPAPGDAQLTASVKSSRPVLPLYMEVPGRNGEAVTIVPPIDNLVAAGAGVGHVNLTPDEDGVVRRAYLAEGTSKKLWPHLAAIASCRATGRACQLAPGRAEAGLVRERPFLIPYIGRRQHFRTVPFSEVFAGSVPGEFLKGRIVLVGATATGLGDSYATPMAERGVLMPGVEVNANIVQALASGRAITPASPGVGLALVILPLWILLAGFLLAPPRFNFLLGLALGMAVIAASAAAFYFAGVWTSPIAALAGLVVVYPLWAWRRLEATHAYMREELERFKRDPDLFVPAERPVAETVQSDIELLRGAIGRARDLQRFVSDTLKGLPDASIVVDRVGFIIMLNERAEALIGSAEGRHFSWIVGELTRGKLAVDPRAIPGPDSLPADIVDAGDRTLDVRWSPIFDREGKLRAWVLRLADVTDLRTATRQREEALQLLTHDMRSPQASIIAALSQAKNDIQSDLATRIENYARRTLELADGFVQLARAEAQALALDEISFSDVILDAVDNLWPLSSAKQMHIETGEVGEEILVRGDRNLLTRAVINLVGNAIKYGPPSSTIRCRLAVETGEAIFTVCDDGPGMTGEQVALLFQPFRQLSRNFAEGAGLGLAFVRSVVVRHGGSVACQSSPGNGACFYLRLPAAEEKGLPAD